MNADGQRARLGYLDELMAKSPKNTRAVPAHIRPMLKSTPTFPVRCKVRLRPITRKPAKVKMFMPKRISLVNTRSYPSAGSNPEAIYA